MIRNANDKEIIDNEVYNAIKASASNFPKGTIKIVSLKNKKEQIVYDRDAMQTITRKLRLEDCPYVVLDYFDNEIFLAIDGYTYMKDENLTTGKLLYFQKNHRAKVDVEQIKSEIKKLHHALRNSKAS